MHLSTMGRRKKYKKRKAVAKPIEPVQESVKKRVSRYMYIPFALALLLYANTIGNDYVLDDALAVLQNEHVQKGLSALPEIFTSNFLDGVGHFNDGLYRPLVVCTYALEHQLAGNSPVLSHAVNILLYALCGLLLFLLLRAIFRDRTEFFSLAICLLFIAHPIHTEAVANIKGRDEILAFLSFTLSAFFLFRYIDRDKLQGLLLSLLFFIFALLSKESAFTLALILPLMPWFFRDVGIRKVLGVFASFFAIALLMWLWRSHVIHSMPNPVDSGIVSALNNSLLSTDSFSDRLATGLYMQVMYIGKMIFPHPLLHDYSYNQIPTIHLGSVPAIFSVFILGCIAFAVIKGFGKKRLFAFGMLFFFITLAATSNLFVFIGATFAERFLFTPALGFSIAIIALFPGLMKARATTLQGVISANKLFSSLMMVLLVGYAVLTIDRNTDWKDNYRLFAADMPYLRHSARAHYNYGTALFESAAEMKDGDEKKRIARRAASELSKAVAIYPAYYDALNNLGNSYRSANMPDSAITVLKQLIEQ
ncbi:MAG: hypothetical protein ACE5DN_00570, partial [Flavobacteriales bacterium]